MMMHSRSRALALAMSATASLLTPSLLSHAAFAQDARPAGAAGDGPSTGGSDRGGMIFSGGPGGFGGGNAEPPVNSRQLKRYAGALGLDEAQQEAAQALLEGMQSEWQAVTAKTRESMDALREEFQQDRDPSIFAQRIPDLMRGQAATRTKLEKAFMADLQSLLSEEQAARWPVVERVNRRETSMPRGRLSGESVDLLSLVEDVKLSEGSLASLRPALDQYELDLDRTLVERNEILDRAQARIGDGPGAVERALRGLEEDEEFKKLRDQAREARLRVRELNQRYARQLAAQLPPDEAARLTSRFTERSFPDVFRSSLAAESFDAAQKFEDLTPEQAQALKAQREAYLLELDRLNTQWMQAQEKFEATEEGYRAALTSGMNIRVSRAGEGDDEKTNPVEEARSARRELDKKNLESLKSILTDAQRERLPKRRERGRGPLGWAGPGDGLGGDGGPMVVAIPAGEGAPPPAEGGVVSVFRTVEIGPDGKPIERQQVFVQREGEGPQGEAGEGDDVEVHVVTGSGPAHEPQGESPDDENEDKPAKPD